MSERKIVNRVKKLKELEEQKAQIEDIVTRKTERNVSDIVITTME